MMSRRRLLCAGRSEYEVASTYDSNKECESNLDGIAISMHSRFEKVDRLPNLNMTKVDRKVCDFVKHLGSISKDGKLEGTIVPDETIDVDVDDFVGACFRRRFVFGLFTQQSNLL
jgi:hypothetical protein